METSPEELHGQVHGVIKALERLSAKERQAKPNAHFGEDFNRLLRLAKECLPDIPQNRWPGEVESTNPHMGPKHAAATYVEIHAYLEQVAEILSQNIEMSFGGVG